MQAGGEALALLVKLEPIYFSKRKEGAAPGRGVKCNVT